MFNISTWRQTKSLRLIALGVLVHISLFFGALDVYFSSPVEHGLNSFKANVSLADRAVIFVADGLRYEAIHDIYSNQHTPFLNKIRLKQASWGICYTRVPTESRPGHVALFGGMYEDPSALLSGWKHNPINVDSVFNQSIESWLWGSPDIIPMFNKDQLKKINTHFYDASFEDFSGGKSTIELDRWVIDRVKEYLLNCKRTKCNLFGKGRIFFLHLLGMDTVGHVFKPNSKQYFANLKYIDEAVKDMYDTFEEFFQDDRTVYIFTSDHGMTDWGSHGSGSDHETQSPFISWGSGVKGATNSLNIHQADVAPFISTLLGINIPTNSVGLTPYDLLNTTDLEEVLILYANLKQLGERFNRRHERIERATIYGLFKPFSKLNKRIYSDKIAHVQKSIDEGVYQRAKEEILQLIELVREGDRYVSQSYKYPLLFALSVGLVLWMVYLALHVIVPCNNEQFEHFISNSSIFRYVVNYIIILITLVAALQYNGIQLKYWFYLFFPGFMVIPLIFQLNRIMYLIVFLTNLPKHQLIINTSACALGMFSLIPSFYFESYIVLPVSLILLWVFSERKKFRNEDVWCWTVALALVCFYPVVSKFLKSYAALQTMTGHFVIMYILIIQIKNIRIESQEGGSKLVLYYYIGKVILLTAAVLSTMVYTLFEATTGLQLFICILSWFILCTSFIFASLSPCRFNSRPFSISVLLYIIFVLMSNVGESLFLLMFIYVQLQWLFLEAGLFDRQQDLTQASNSKRTSDKFENEAGYEDFRRCLFFIFFILLSYFGAGNLANMNTFDPMWARQFVLTFNPFLSAIIILFKITIPFLIATIFFQTINTHTHTATINVFSIIMFFCEILVIYFMHSIKNEGSWLFIGLSISRFVIVSFMTLALLLFYGIAKFLTQNRLLDSLSFTKIRALKQSEFNL